MAAKNGYGGSMPLESSAWSPLFQGWNNWATMWGTSLPRTFDTFRSGQFSPFEPIPPNPIDLPEPPGGRPRPRRFQFPVGWNLPVGQPGTEGIKLANFQALRDMAEIGSIPRSIIEICKTDIVNLIDSDNGLETNIVPTKVAEKAMQGNPAKRKDFEERRAEAIDFFMDLDPHSQYRTLEDWVNGFEEDGLVLDAVAIHIQPARGGRKAGPFGSGIGALALLDGSTVRPLLNTHGEPPAAPQPAFQQFQWGVPRVDLMDIINLGPGATIEDLKELSPLLDEMTETIDEWDGDQLAYIKTNPRNWTPYGFGPLEQCLLPAAILLARQQWQWERFRSGSIPEMFIDPGEKVATAEEARELQEAMNMLAGDLGAMHQLFVLPPGAKPYPQREGEVLADNFDELMISEMCMPFGLMISDLGMTPKIGGLQSAQGTRAAGQAATDRTTRRSTLPRAERLQRFFTYILQVKFGQKDMRWSWGIEEEGESQDDIVKRWVSMTGGNAVNIASIDEGRIAVGLDPLGLPETSVPLIVPAGQTAPFPVSQLGDMAQASLDSATADAENKKNPPPMLQPGPAANGVPGGGKQLPAAEATPAKAGASAVSSQQGAKPGANTADKGAPNDKAASEGKKPKKGAATTTQSSATKMLDPLGEAELQILERHLQRGRAAKSFVPKALRREALLAAKWESTPALAVKAARFAHNRATRRDTYLQAARDHVSTGLGRLVNRLRQETINPIDFVDQARDILRTGMNAAVTAGVNHAREDYPRVTKAKKAKRSDADTIAQVATERADAQEGYLTGMLASTLQGASISQLAARADLYGESLTAGYEQGYGETAMSTLSDPVIIWNCEDDPCELCAPRDGVAFTAESLPGWPGDGGFGAICEGGPKCRCWLEYKDQANTQTLSVGANTLRPAALDGSMAAELGPVGHAEVWTSNNQSFIDSLPDEVAPGDITSARERAQARLDIRKQIAEETGGNPADVTAAAVSQRLSPAMKKLDLPKPGVVDWQVVHELLSETYPDKALEWVEHMKWRLTSIAVDRISVTGPSSNHDMKDIEEKAEKFEDGKVPKPVVLVDPGDDGLLQVADGHHRVTAAVMAKMPLTLPSFVGTPTDPKEDWRPEVMEMQLARATKNFSLGMTGSSDVSMVPFDLVPGAQRTYPASTTSGALNGRKVKAAGIALVAADTGRVLMQQRALDPDDPHGGKWEFPGGHLEGDESSLDGAVREFQEEAGLPLPEGIMVAAVPSPNGIYVLHVHVVPHEAEVPINLEHHHRRKNPDDPDGDQVEVAAWWSVRDAQANPALRDECKQSPWGLIEEAPRRALAVASN